MENIFNTDDTEETVKEETAEISKELEEFEEREIEAKKTKTARKPFRVWLEGENAVRTVYLIFGFCVIVLLMVLLQFSTSAICCGDWDGYYHIRWSAMIWESFKNFQWIPEFKWLPLTVLNPSDYADHHFLFHLLQIPFLWFFKPVLAAKIAAVFYGSLAIFSVYWLLYRYKVKYLLLWLGALLTCSNPFFYRMNMAKAPPLTIIYSVIGIYLLFERKYIWLIPLMFVFVWTYSLFPLLFLATLIWAAIIGWNEKKLEWQPVAYAGIGMILGNLINPFFPNNLGLFWEHLSTKIGNFDVAVGGEWYPYKGTELLTHLTIALVAMLIGYVLFRPRNEQLPEKATFFLVFSTVLLIWMFKSKRLAEYFPPFAILFCAFSWKSFFKSSLMQLPEDFRDEIGPLLDSSKMTEKQELTDTFKRLGLVGLGIFFLFLMFYNFIGVNIKSLGIKQEGLVTSIRKNEADDKYVEAMDWALENIPEGERILNSNWDDFPKLFFLNTKHSYVYGLDPKYLHSQDTELSRLVKEITSGKLDDPAPVIVEKFGAKYIFSDAKESEDFIAKILESGWADKVYEDTEAYIIRIRDKKGEPPPELEDDTPRSPDEERELKEAEKADENVNTNPNINGNVDESEEVDEDDSDLDEELDPDEEPLEDEDELPPSNDEPADETTDPPKL